MAQPIVNNVSWRIGGQQGEGIDSTGDIFAKAVARFSLDSAMLLTAGLAATLGASAVGVPKPPAVWLVVFAMFYLI